MERFHLHSSSRLGVLGHAVLTSLALLTWAGQAAGHPGHNPAPVALDPPAPPSFALPPAPIDLDVNGLGVFNDNTNVNPAQVAIGGGMVAFTLTTRSKLVSADPLKWAFPVRELPGNAWLATNGGNFSGGSEGYNHKHVSILPAAPAMGTHYGSHPHLQMFIYAQKPGAAPQPLELIGFSDLKHTFATKASAPLPNQAAEEADPHHYLNMGTNDVYTNNSNKDRNFLGELDELNFTTFKVDKHDHFGAEVMIPDPANPGNMIPLVEDGFKVYERDHGEPQHAGNDFAHRLKTDITKLLLTTENNGGTPGVQPVGTKFYFAASYFVFDPNLNAGAGGREMDLSNNSVFREFNPNWNGTNFGPTWVGDTLRLLAAPRTFVPVDQPGAFVEPVPEPGSLLLLVIGVALLGGRQRRR